MGQLLKGKVALITGASRGIGRAIAIEFGKAGALIAINYLKDDIGAKKTSELLTNNNIYHKIYKGDVKDFNFVNQMMDSVEKDFGRLDILVNNAGISKIGLLIDMTEEDFNEVMDTNFRSVFNCSNLAVKKMLKNNGGSIINISSIWGKVGASCEVLYSASKGAVESFTKALGKELAPSNIRVNGIAPGVIDTAMNNIFSKEDRQNITSDIPMMRFGLTEEIGNAALFLASEKASYITAQILNVDGGYL